MFRLHKADIIRPYVSDVTYTCSLCKGEMSAIIFINICWLRVYNLILHFLIHTAWLVCFVQLKYVVDTGFATLKFVCRGTTSLLWHYSLCYQTVCLLYVVGIGVFMWTGYVAQVQELANAWKMLKRKRQPIWVTNWWMGEKSDEEMYLWRMELGRFRSR